LFIFEKYNPYLLRIISFMAFFKKVLTLLLICFWNTKGIAQENLQVFSDYLSDNLYIAHPAAAGVGNSGKIRLSTRNKWLGVKNAPNTQTLSYHNRYEDKGAMGLILFNDENGFFSKKGVYATYAYHLNLAKDLRNFKQLSFGFSATFSQEQFDASIFSTMPSDNPGKDTYFNGDFGMAYHKNSFFSYLTIKNLFPTRLKKHNSESFNFRKVLLYTGYFFGDKNKIQYEPSVLAMYDSHFDRIQLDINMKAYKLLDRGHLWAAISFITFLGDDTSLESLNYLSPVIGINYLNYVFSYTYTSQLGSLDFSPEGYHQLSLGMDVFVRKPRLAACPNINSGFFN